MTPVLPDNLPILDAVQIEELRDLDGGAGDLLARIVGVFVTHTENHLAALGELLQSENQDLAKIGAIAHDMCSGAGSVGARRLAQLCHQVQADARTGNASNMMDGLTRIRAEFAMVRSAVAALAGPNLMRPR